MNKDTIHRSGAAKQRRKSFSGVGAVGAAVTSKIVPSSIDGMTLLSTVRRKSLSVSAPSLELGSSLYASTLSLTLKGGGGFKLSKDDEILETRLLSESRSARNQYVGLDVNEISRSRMHWRPKNFGEKGLSIITQNIVLGNNTDARNLSFLKQIGVTHVLNAANNIPCHHVGSLIYCQIDLEDTVTASFAPFEGTVIKFIKRVESLNGRVLIHCKSGVSRSVSVLLKWSRKFESKSIISSFSCGGV